jgi:hypothetical protein
MITVRHSIRHLPWKVAFQMEALTQNMAIDFKEAGTLYPAVQQMVQEKGGELVAKALREFRHQTDRLFHSEDDDTAELVELFMQNVDALDNEDIVTPPRPADGSLYDAFHVDIMPTMYLDGPFTEQPNRVIRAHDAHQDCFLRVSFVDEARLQYRFDHEIDGREFIKTRIGPLSYDNICTSDSKYQFTDGVGTCSKELSRNIWAQLKTFPSTASKAESSTIRSTPVSNLVGAREYIFSENSYILWLLEWNNAGNARSSAAEGTQISTKTSMQE